MSRQQAEHKTASDNASITKQDLQKGSHPHKDFANGLGVALDFGGNVAFVVGPEVPEWKKQDLRNAVVESSVDGAVVATGSGVSALDNPINSVVWMAETLARQGRQLKAGEWVSTGTCTTPIPAQGDTTYSAKFSEFGEVSIKFT